MKQKISLVIESSSEGLFWGRASYEDNLIIDSASDIIKLEKKMKKLLLDFHLLNSDEVEFQIKYDNLIV